jgi:uncharacterized Zn-finger protein
VNLKNLFGSYSSLRIILVMWLISSGFILFSLTRIDNIVHGTLYNYGLQFSDNWAQPYWAFDRLIYFTMSIPMVLSLLALFSGLLRGGSGEKPVSRRVEPNARNILISCSHCRKVFSKPLVVLDFSGGKRKFVSVCPYCNAVLDSAENEKDTGIIPNVRKEVVH